MKSELIVPSPEKTLKTFFEIIISKDFLPAVSLTIFRGLLGFLISFILGVFIGILTGLNSSFNAFFKPIIITIRSTPVIALILLALIWLKTDFVPIFIAFLTMFPVITINIAEGIKNVDKDLIEMAKIYKVKMKRIISDIYIPSIVPFIISGVSTAIGFGWRAVIIGEVLSQPKYGIGTFMQNAQTYLLVTEVIAWTIIAVIIGYLFEKLIRLSEKRIVTWKQI
ncbi:MAG: ABC transporter permease subunit [Bacteroidales bacterium]|nr:ABC transporter permease subunit [Bacteroidales bacterium]